MSGQVNEKYIPINKGHFELDTPERHSEFHRKLSNGWEAEYEEYRRLWVDLPKKRIIRDYPLLVDLELSSACNLLCPMCYTITDEFKGRVKRSMMEFELFKKIVREIAGKVFAIRLSLRGEPTLHPNFIECITFAKEQGIKEISSLTNGSRLSLDYFKRMAEAGLDWLTISIDGINEEYEKIRRPLKFIETLQKLKDIHAYKTAEGLIKPVIKVQGIWPSIRPNPTDYYETIMPYVDIIAYNPLIDYLRKDSEIVYEDNFACPQLYQRLVVGSDGRVMGCSNDENSEQVIGDAYSETIHAIWHGTKMMELRKIHEQPEGFKELSVCKHCYYPRKAVPDEKARVGDREIWIENYINRKQNIGE